jgi:hypothetical protein
MKKTTLSFSFNNSFIPLIYSLNIGNNPELKKILAVDKYTCIELFFIKVEFIVLKGVDK